MKRSIITILTILLVFSLFSSSLALAYELPVRIVVNGQKITLPDAQPFIDAQSRTQVPLRFVSEALGAKVGWDSKNQKVTVKLDGKNVVLYIGKKEYQVDGVTKKMDTGALLKQNRTFVPIRFVSEALGASVKWESVIRTVYINTDGKTPEPVGDEIKVAEVHGFTIYYSEMGKNASPVYVTESRLRVSEFEGIEKDRAIMHLGITFSDINSNPKEATNEAEQILRQKVESSVVDSIMEYVRSKTKREDMLDQKIFTDTSYEIHVSSKESNDISILLFRR